MNYIKSAKIGFGTSNIVASTHLDHWKVGELSLRHAIDVGYKVIDTAEQYGNGRSENLIGKVLTDTKKRNEIEIVSKVLPSNASTKELIFKSCINSIKRLQCDYIDVYLLHWRDPADLPLAPIIEAFMELKSKGLIKNYGVSNFGGKGLREWKATEEQLGLKFSVAVNQHHYSITQRDPERYYLDWQQEHNIVHMAYSPISNKRNNILNNPSFIKISQEYGFDPAQLAIAWTIRKDGVMAIPSSTNFKNIELNFSAQDLILDNDVLAAIDKEFPL